ncbi:MAG: DNA-deoxyinosine glycosylase [Christensenellaceae bacterium]
MTKKGLSNMMQRITHEIPPVYDKNSKILILGSLPSVKSREVNFYYGNPKNRFYEVIASIVECEKPDTIEEKKEMLHKNHIAVFDVIKECEIHGSADTSIKNVIVNDFSEIFHTANIKKVFANGKKAYELYQKYCAESDEVKIVYLPSTSPANAAYGFERLRQEWQAIKEYLR